MTLNADFDGEPLNAPEGATIGAALVAAGHQTWRTTRGGKARGLFCGIGVCYDCLVVVDGRTERACMVPLREGTTITSHGSTDEQN